MHLVLATEERQARRDALTFAAWGTCLTPEAYALREQRLRAHPWARQALQTWLLCEDDGAELASCEVLRMDSVLRGPEGAPAPGDSFVIASVFTEARLRGRGYATRLMDRVAARLQQSSARAHAALLFSDVGAALYERSGYRALPAWDWQLGASPGEPSQAVDRLLSEADVADALARMRRPHAPFFLWPSAAQVDWHLERERIYAQALGRPRPGAQGATAGDSTALWGIAGQAPELKVLMLDARSPEEARALLEAASRVAHEAGAPRVVVWEEPASAPLLAAVPGARRVPREGSLPMLRPLGPALPSLPSGPPLPRALWA